MWETRLSRKLHVSLTVHENWINTNNEEMLELYKDVDIVLDKKRKELE